MHKSIILTLLMLTLSLSFLQAQNSTIENFSLPDAFSGNTVSLNDFQAHKAVVVLFTSNYCPYSKLYEERFAEMVKAYASKNVGFLMINPNDPRESKDDSMEAMKAKAGSWGMGIPYLADQQQRVARLFAASKTPEIFILAKAGNTFSIAYSGAIDDNPQVAQDVTQLYASQALDMVLQGKKVPRAQRRPVGCMIKMKN